MKTIKIRAWHKGQEKMYSAEEMGQDELTLSVDGRGFVNVSGERPEKSIYITDMVPELFTGMLDFNGVEIYEGDIVEFVEDDIEEWVRREVFFDDEQLCFGVKCSFQLFHAQFGSEFRVIGNIHENPELLK